MAQENSVNYIRRHRHLRLLHNSSIFPFQGFSFLLKIYRVDERMAARQGWPTPLYVVGGKRLPGLRSDDRKSDPTDSVLIVDSE